MHVSHTSLASMVPSPSLSSSVCAANRTQVLSLPVGVATKVWQIMTARRPEEHGRRCLTLRNADVCPKRARCSPFSSCWMSAFAASVKQRGVKRFRCVLWSQRVRVLAARLNRLSCLRQRCRCIASLLLPFDLSSSLILMLGPLVTTAVDGWTVRRWRTMRLRLSARDGRWNPANCYR